MADPVLSKARRRGVSRRSFLKTIGVAGAAGAAPAFLRTPAGAQDGPLTPARDPGAKRGGTLRYGIISAPAHFDLHQSGTVSNIGAQGPMYDCLIRRDPHDGQTIIPDLAYKWDIAPDGKKYTFHLRKGVKFHDGADFTAADVKATYDRIVRPPKGVVIPRSSLFTAVGEIVVLDPYRIEFRLTEPRPQAFMLAGFACGWNVIVRKKSLDDNQGNLRQVMNYPGTGPFRHVSRKDKEVWIQERNPNYWNKGLPYLDHLEVYHLAPFSPELGSAFLSGKIDYARLLDPGLLAESQGDAGRHRGRLQPVGHPGILDEPEKDKAFQDARVRRAIHLAMDRHVLVDVVKDTAPMQVGGFVYPFHEASTPKAELEKRLGYQKDPKAAIQEAQKLMKEAGYGQGLKGLDFVVREANTFKLWAVAIQAMLKENLNVECNLRVVQISQWFEEAAAGNFDLAISAIVSSVMDPSDYFEAWYGKNGPQNYAGWTNEQFHSLAHQIEREVDESKRKAMIRQAENILEMDPPLIPVAYEQIYDAWYNRVHGQNPSKYFGIYDVVRWDTVWMG